MKQKLKILLVTEHVGRTAPGRVFETIIESLTDISDVTLITSHYDYSNTNISIKAKIIKVNEPIFIDKRIMIKIDKIFLRLFSISLKDLILRNRVYRVLRRHKSLDYQIILGLCSAHCLSPVSLINRIKQTSGRKGVYLVDACPNPDWWNPGKESKGISNYLKHFTKNMDFFISSNPLMLEYQKKYINPNVKDYDIIYPIVGKDKIILPKKSLSDPIIFLYTGGIYGIRTAENIFLAFEIFHKEFPTSKLVFVGTSKLILNYCPPSITNAVEIYEFTNKLTEFYTKSSVLLDIDANVETDIFLSSKITNYLLANRPILCETGKNTPSRYLFSGMESVVLCDHDAKSLYEGMKRIINKEFDYSERDKILELFKVDRAIQSIIDQSRFKS